MSQHSPSAGFSGARMSLQGPGVAGKVALSPAEALDAAGKLYYAGRLQQAEQICRQVISNRPTLPDAHNLLGIVRNARGDPEGAVEALRQAIRLNPSIPSYHSNLGEIERQRGNLDEAQAALTRALELDPNTAQAYSNLGIVHFDRKEFEEAAACYEKAIALQPNFPEAHNNLGNAYRALERRKEAIACYQRAVAQREGYAEAYNNMATALRDGEDVEAAEHAYRKAVMLKPDYLDAYNNLAIMYSALDRTDDALRTLADALKVDEKHIKTLLNVSKVQLKRGAHEIARQAAQMALDIDPDNAETYYALGDIQHELDQPENALSYVDQAIERDAEAGDFHSFRGVILKNLGRLEEARLSVRKALELNPKLYGAYSNLNDLETFSADHELTIKMKEILAEAEEPEADRYVPIYFTLGKALDDSGDHVAALEHYKTGARLRRAQLEYDEADNDKFFDDICASFPKEIFENRPYKGHPSDAPVFIIGMPRSGSTLAEQILSSHPKAFGAGEIKVLHRSMGVLRDRFPSIPKFPAMVEALEPEHFEQIANGYIEEVRRRAGPEPLRITDKLLTNFFFAGLINLLFPNAKMIHTRRNPVDTCLSAFTKLFKDDMPHSYDFGELGRYYLKYEQVMAHWEKVLPPGVLMTVDYESVTEDLEANARAMVDHVGLEWDDACLAFYKSSRPVKTASVAQVRKPIYKTSVERWRRYGDGLQPLLDALNYPRIPDKAKAQAKGGAAPKAASPKKPVAKAGKTAPKAQKAPAPKAAASKAAAAKPPAPKAAPPKAAAAKAAAAKPAATKKAKARA